MGEVGVRNTAPQQPREDLAGLLRHAGEGGAGIRRCPLLSPRPRRQVQLPRQPSGYPRSGVSHSLGDPTGRREIRQRRAAERMLGVGDAALAVGVAPLQLHAVLFVVGTVGERNDNGRIVLEHKGLQLYRWRWTRDFSAKPDG